MELDRPGVGARPQMASALGMTPFFRGGWRAAPEGSRKPAFMQGVKTELPANAIGNRSSIPCYLEDPAGDDADEVHHVKLRCRRYDV
jgi:hypothetical protein